MKCVKTSIIYKSIYIYRFVLNLLYLGGYRRRFAAVIDNLRTDDVSVLELCFGDTVIAEHCRVTGMNWIGFDLSEAFVAYAIAEGYDARNVDLLSVESLPTCDVCVMMGSLYHFHGHYEGLFRLISECSQRLIISEPIKNWTDGPGLLSFVARYMTRSGKGDESFRFNRDSLLAEINRLRNIIPFDFRTIDCGRDIIVEVTWLR